MKNYNHLDIDFAFGIELANMIHSAENKATGNFIGFGTNRSLI